MSTTTTRPVLTGRNKVGLLIAVLLGAADLGGPSPAGVAALFFFAGSSFEPVEPLVLGGFIAAGMLGLATVIGVILTWAKGSRVAARVVAAARVISLLMTSLIFVVQEEGLAAWVYVIAAAVVILDVVAVVLVLSRPGVPSLPAG